MDFDREPSKRQNASKKAAQTWCVCIMEVHLSNSGVRTVLSTRLARSLANPMASGAERHLPHPPLLDPMHRKSEGVASVSLHAQHLIQAACHLKVKLNQSVFIFERRRVCAAHIRS